jgi:hypothetical protein
VNHRTTPGGEPRREPGVRPAAAARGAPLPINRIVRSGPPHLALLMRDVR